MKKNHMYLFIRAKVLLFTLCVVLVLMHRFLFSANAGGSDPIWFQPQYSMEQIKKALREAKNVDTRNFLGQTGLMAAIAESEDYGSNSFDLIKLFIRSGANVNAKSDPSPREEDYSYSNTPLHYAALKTNNLGMLKIIDYLVDKGADVNAENSLGETPLMWSLQITGMDDRTLATKTIIADLANVNLQNNKKQTYLHLAVRIFDIEWVQYLMKAYGSMFDLELRDNEGRTAEEYADVLTRTYIRDAIRDRRKIGIDDNVNERDLLGRTGLMLAIIRNDQPFAERQIEHRADVNARDTTRFANTPLQFAVMRQYNMVPFVNVLLANGADPNLQNRYGNTPLHYLIKFNIHSAQRNAVAQSLVNAGARISKENSSGLSVIDAARQKDQGFANSLQAWSNEVASRKNK